jgi:hypothetical protein
MADDINVTPAAGGVPCATDELAGGRHAQLIKLLFGGDGAGTMASETDPYPTIARPYLPTVARCNSSAINVAGSGDNQLLAGTGGQTIRVWKFWLVAAAAVSLKFRDGTTDLHPAIALVAGGSWLLDLDGEPWFVTAAGNALNLNLSAAVQVSGRWYYTKS